MILPHELIFFIAEQGQQMAEESGIGAVSFVSCATGSDPPKTTTEDDDDDQSQSKFPKLM